jgi:SHS family lactate transporter-like MFS transporter
MHSTCELSVLVREEYIAESFAFSFTVSYTVPELAKTFDQTNANVTWGISLVLMLRFVGAAIFGIASDRYGRKWPFVVNNLLFIVLELGTGFTQTYSQFLGVRALFGISMGGLYGNIAATALEDCPEEARGVVSGILQQGYTFGYLLCTIFSRALVNTTSHGWRPLFWFGACPPVIFIIIRLFLPETDAYLERRALREQAGGTTANFLREGRLCFKEHWFLLIYLVLLMSGFNFMVSGEGHHFDLQRLTRYRRMGLKTSIRRCCLINITSRRTGSPLPSAALNSVLSSVVRSPDMPHKSLAVDL